MRKVELGADELAAAFVDAIEQSTNRPARGQKRYDSGKKKWHTLKHQVVVVRKKKRAGRGGPRPRKVRIAAVSEAAPGPPTTRRCTTGPGWNSRGAEAGDKAYLGTPLRVPARKPRGRPLPRRQKAGNRRRVRDRAVAGHGIGKMTVWRIAADRDRNPRSRHTVMMKNVSPAAERHTPPRAYCATSLPGSVKPLPPGSRMFGWFAPACRSRRPRRCLSSSG